MPRHLRPAFAKDLPAVSLLISRIYDKLGGEADRQKSPSFYNFIGEEALLERLREGSLMLIVEGDEGLQAFLEMRGQHLSLLFVAEQFRRQGLARELLREALATTERIYSQSVVISVNARIESLPVYESLGFMVSGGENNEEGMRTMPMICVLPKNLSKNTNTKTDNRI